MNDLAQVNTVINEQLHYLVPEVRCAGCCLKIERALHDVPGISAVNVNYAEKRLSFRPGSASGTQAVLARLLELGYKALPEKETAGLAVYQAERRALLARLGVAGIGMMQVMMFALTSYLAGPEGLGQAYATLMHWAALVISTPVVLYSAMPFHRGAWRDMRQGTPGMDVPVSIAVNAAFLLSVVNTLSGQGEVYFDSACMFTFFLLTGRYLELTARQHFHIERLLGDHLLPPLARLVSGEQVPVGMLAAGNLLEIRPGEVIPADCVVTAGTTTANEAAFTGESEPAFKTTGSLLLAGSMNLDGDIQGRVTGAQPEWVISHLSESYRNAAAFKPAFAMMADRIARYFVSVVLVLSAGSGLYWWLQGDAGFFAVALSVLVVSCPCALSLATPVSYAIATGAVRRMGLLVSSGSFLEKLPSVTTIVFDKTGTLTEGRMKLEAVHCLNGEGEQALINIAASLEAGSLHPIAVSLRESADRFHPVTDILATPGSGISGSIGADTFTLGRPAFVQAGISVPPGGGSWVLLAKNHQPVAWFCFSDCVRHDARATLDRLLRYTGTVKVFSGDSAEAGRELMQSLGIEAPGMAMTPDDKISGVRDLQAAGECVLLVGDGLNDAGAMAVADLSISVNPVDTLVQSAADATLVNGQLGSIPAALVYAGRVKAVIRQNLSWALVYNLSVIPLAVLGFVPPWLAALGMSLSSLMVTLNACRLARVN